MTTAQLVEHTGWSDKSVRLWLHSKQDAGLLDVRRVASTNLCGSAASKPAYRVKRAT
jgi:hypothetical protein